MEKLEVRFSMGGLVGQRIAQDLAEAVETTNRRETLLPTDVVQRVAYVHEPAGAENRPPAPSEPILPTMVYCTSLFLLASSYIDRYNIVH